MFMIAGAAPLGALTGGLLSGLPLARFGRRATLMLAAVIFVVGYLLLATSREHEALAVILLSRVAKGLAVGLAIPAAQIYVRTHYITQV